MHHYFGNATGPPASVDSSKNGPQARPTVVSGRHFNYCCLNVLGRRLARSIPPPVDSCPVATFSPFPPKKNMLRDSQWRHFRNLCLGYEPLEMALSNVDRFREHSMETLDGTFDGTFDADTVNPLFWLPALRKAPTVLPSNGR